MMTGTKRTVGDFAAVGGVPTFDPPLPVGQLYFPDWDRYEGGMRAIFEREYYTNHGPAVKILETRIEEMLGVNHALTVMNASVGLYLVAMALGLKGKVLMPAFTFIATAQAMSWAGMQPVFCDVDEATHQISRETAERGIVPGVEAIVGVNLWGGCCGSESLQRWAAGRDLEVFFDSAQAFGCRTTGGPIGTFGRAEVFSFHATKVVSAGEGGCITTNDDELAELIRNMRSNYGIRSAMDVPLTINARMSEAQATIAMASLDDFDRNVAANARVREVYRRMLQELRGLHIVEPAGVVFSNQQSVVCEIDEAGFGLSRDALIAVLVAEGVVARRYFYPGLHQNLSIRQRKYRREPAGDRADLPSRGATSRRGARNVR